MEYKSSKYTMTTTAIDGSVILYNSLYNSIRKYDGAHRNKIISCLETGVSEDDSLFNDLIAHGFIISAEYNELAYAKSSFLRCRSNPDLSLTILPTMGCNFNCPYCYEKNEMTIMSEEMQSAIIKYVKKNISRYTGVHLSWFGGEPLMTKDIIFRISEEVQNICRNRYKRMSGTITTNAYNLDIQTFLRLISLGIRIFQITVDGLKNTHDSQRYLKNGGGTFDVIMANLLKIKKLSPSIHFNIIIRTNVSNAVYDVLPQYTSYMKETFGDDKRFSFLMREVSDWGGEKIHDFRNNLITGGLTNIFRRLANCDMLNYSPLLDDLIGNPLCYAGKMNDYVICVDGKIRKCTCEMTNDKDSYNIIGKLDPTGSMKIDRYKEALWLQDFSRELCNNCSFYGGCMGCYCPNYYMTGNTGCSAEVESTNDLLRLLARDDSFVGAYKER